MPKRSSKKKSRPRDINKLANEIVNVAIGDKSDINNIAQEKNPHAVALGRLGGKKGGKARAKKLSAERRSEIAKLAAQARYSNKS